MSGDFPTNGFGVDHLSINCDLGVLVQAPSLRHLLVYVSIRALGVPCLFTESPLRDLGRILGLSVGFCKSIVS